MQRTFHSRCLPLTTAHAWDLNLGLQMAHNCPTHSQRHSGDVWDFVNHTWRSRGHRVPFQTQWVPRPGCMTLTSRPRWRWRQSSRRVSPALPRRPEHTALVCYIISNYLLNYVIMEATCHFCELSGKVYESFHGWDASIYWSTFSRPRSIRAGM